MPLRQSAAYIFTFNAYLAEWLSMIAHLHLIGPSGSLKFLNAVSTSTNDWIWTYPVFDRPTRTQY